MVDRVAGENTRMQLEKGVMSVAESESWQLYPFSQTDTPDLQPALHSLGNSPKSLNRRENGKNK